jgi:hypothetical protein
MLAWRARCGSIPGAVATIHSRPQTLAKRADENLRAVLHSLFWLKILATASTVGET